MSEKAFPALNAQLDGNDRFVTQAHQEIQTFGATRHAERMKRVPVWVNDNQKLKELLITVFPKMNSDSKQRQSALVWMKIIQLYWKAGMTAAQVATQMHMTVKQVQNYLQGMNKVAAGKDSAGRVKTGRARGRPRKNSQGIQTISGNDGADAITSLDN